MSFDFSQFPFYNPLQRSEWNPATVLPTLHDKRVAFSIQEHLHQLHAEIDIRDFTDERATYLQKSGCATIFIRLDKSTTVSLSYSPLGLKHLVVNARDVSSALIEIIDTEIQPHTISIAQPTLSLMNEYINQSAWMLRSDLVRWFYPLDFTIDQWPGKDRYRYMRQLKKSESLRTENAVLNNETVKQFLRIWEKEIVGRKGGMRMFYEQVFQDPATWEAEVPVVFFYENSDDVPQGGLVVNPFGSFGDFRNRNQSYHSLWMQAYRPQILNRAPAYRAAEIIQEIARKRGDVYTSQGGDLALWGAEIRTGLLQQKSSLMMRPYPEGNIELFSVRRPYEIIQKSNSSHLVFYTLLPDAEIVKNAIHSNTHHIVIDTKDLQEVDFKMTGMFYIWSPNGQQISQKIPYEMRQESCIF